MMLQGDASPRRGIRHGDAGVHLLGERLHDIGTQPGLGRASLLCHADSVVAHRERPIGTAALIIDRDLAVPSIGERMLERVDDQLRHHQTKADRYIGLDLLPGTGDFDRDLVMIMDHRCPDALAQLVQIWTDIDLVERGDRQLPLDRRDRHHATVRVPQMPAHLFRLNLAGALQQYAGDDLQTVRDAVLQFLQQHALVMNQIVIHFFGDASIGDVRYGKQQARFGTHAITEFMRVQDQAPCAKAGALQVEFVILDLSEPRRRCLEERLQLRNGPFAVAQIGKGFADDCFGIDVEGCAEGVAGDDDSAIFVQQQHGRVGGANHREGKIEAEFGIGRNGRRHRNPFGPGRSVWTLFGRGHSGPVGVGTISVPISGTNSSARAIERG
ncbi:hypothetical protein D9M73_110750 [compost metagenome]